MDKESKTSSASFKLTQASYNYVQNLSKTYVLSLKRDGEILVESYFFFSFPSNGLFYKKKKRLMPQKNVQLFGTTSEKKISPQEALRALK